MEGGPPMFGQGFTCPALLEDTNAFYPYGAVTRYGPTFQTVPVLTLRATGLVRVRSPLLTESRLMSFPPGTEMFQFPGFASAAYGFSGGSSMQEGVAPFGDPRIKACSRLPKAFRSVPRPSSPLGAKASTRCPCFPRPPPATTAPRPHQARPAGPRRRRTDEEEASGGRRRERFQRQLPLQALADRWPKPASGQHTHAKHAPCRRRKKRAGRTRLAGARRTTTHARIAPSMPARRAPRHHLTMSKEHAPPHRPNRAGGAQTGCPLRAAGPGPGHDGRTSPTGKRGLVGLGRLERPTSRLSGVRSNQLSYRPERHPAGPERRAARAGRAHDLGTRGPLVRRLCAKGRADGGGRF